MEIGYKSVVGLDAVKGLKTEQEPNLDRTREEIERNIRKLQSKLGSPMTDADISLYGALKTNLRSINISDLTWRDPEANMIISDDSSLVKNLGVRQKQLFLEPCENMKCVLPTSVTSRCDEFVNNFNNNEVPEVLRNIIHNKEWKENDDKLIERTNRILSVLREIWKNPAFATSEMRSSQSEGTYITDVIVPLLRAGLEDLPNGTVCLSTAEWQSIASKTRKSLGSNEERTTHPQKTPIGKKPDVMLMEKCGGKIFEIAYVESSRIVCTNSKKDDDSVKLWRETQDGISFVNIACRLLSNQFGIVGIQVSGEELYLNVLVKDANGIPRYFHLNQAQIPFSNDTSWRVIALVHLLLTLRNITIVNKSLLMHALEQANTRPPRNVNPSPTVSSPLNDN
ncbi:unnamed protein product [Rhizophagus irregularis]|uniref:Uncharacterized protein n=1 Tax=Rhizophagus irregularis TaxID=588596 RepID=A0A2N1MA43_9GLOM|nr:hypothetical protein RhiirC2_857758 [Rhizophagus irregularis]CAB4381326.1 unnamed protein product [Rhizophagus irregularis]CAB5393388.1 unnamed protein product [Rhizophagus irregularis]